MRFCLTCALSLCFLTSPGWSADRPLAESHFEAGQQAYRDQRWDVARIEFQAAYQLSHEPDLLYNLSVIEEKDGNTSEAVTYARRYLAEKGAAISTKDADEVRGRIARLESMLKPPPAAVIAAGPVPQPPPPPKTSTPAIVANGAIVGGGVLTLAGIGCLVGAWTTGQAAQDPAISYQQWVDLGSTGRALNAAGLGLTIAGGAVLVGSTAWRIAIAKRAK